jgi:hypothetical protein
MWTDPIVEETRRIRDEHAKKFDYNVRAMFEDLKVFEQSLATSSTLYDAKQKTSGRQKKELGKTKARRASSKLPPRYQVPVL